MIDKSTGRLAKKDIFFMRCRFKIITNPNDFNSNQNIKDNTFCQKDHKCHIPKSDKSTISRVVGSLGLLRCKMRSTPCNSDWGSLSDVELSRVTINSHLPCHIDMLLVNKSYCALGHTYVVVSS